MHCQSCGAVAARPGRFCDQCGASLAPPAPFEAGDRRVVTALFADIVGFTRLVAELDAEDVRACVDDALGRLAVQVGRFGGTLEKFIGDAVFAVFGAPVAHDDDAVRASLCALAMRSAVRAAGSSGGATPLELRIGLASGEVVAAPREVGGHRSLALVGSAITTAARLQQLAEPGQILMDAPTVAASGSRIATEPLPPRVLRGIGQPTPMFRLLEERTADSPVRRPLAELVGRDRERARLRGMLAETAATGRGRVCVVVGEAGMGKSRLLADLEADARAAGFGWTWAQNVSYGSGQPYRLVRRIVETLADEAGTDAGGLVRRLLFTPDLDADLLRAYSGAVAALARDAAVEGWESEAELAPRDAREIARLLQETVARFAERLGAAGRRVVVLDDMHWADASSLPLVEAFARSCAAVPILLLIGTRPGRRDELAALAHAERIDLHGLGPEATARLAAAVAGLQPTAATATLLHERSGGNPLFVTEIVRALLEARVLAPGPGGLAVTDPSRVGLLPLGLRALLGARIDSLAPDARSVLGVASVVGMRFSEATIGDLIDRPADQADFVGLAEAGLIEPAEVPGAWRFAHPLFHDAAYVGLLAAQRRALHARLADRLERGAQPVDVARLAHHRAAAGDAERAIPLLERAATAAVAIGASIEAAGFLRRAGELAGGERAAAFTSRADEVLATAPLQ